MLSELPEIPRVSVLNYKPAQDKARAIIERQGPCRARRPCGPQGQLAGRLARAGNGGAILAAQPPDRSGVASRRHLN